MSSSIASLSILHVDDDPAFGGLVKRFLEREGSALECSVTTEQNPARALDRIDSAETVPDCVISDYNMPEMDGIDFLTAVRDRAPELPVLLFSGERTDEIAVEIIQAGVSDYLRKGLGTDQYTMLIRRVTHAIDAEGGFDADAETTLDGVGIVGTDEQFERADEAYSSLYGYSPGEITGKHWTELHPDEEVEHIRTHVLPVVEQGGRWTGRSEGLRADDTTFTESKMVTAIDDGRLLIAVSEAEGPDEQTEA
jgi:PAS domain S-box-containing protein